jgi:hypothetical protein
MELSKFMHPLDDNRTFKIEEYKKILDKLIRRKNRENRKR